MSRLRTATGLTISAAAAIVLLAPTTLADTALADTATPSPRPSRPTVSVPSVVPGGTASPSQTPPGRQGGDIEVPAGKADVGGTGHPDDLLLVVLAGGGALLLAGGIVVAVSRRAG